MSRLLPSAAKARMRFCRVAAMTAVVIGGADRAWGQCGTWLAVGAGIEQSPGSTVHAVNSYQGALIVAGKFSSASGQSASNIASWNGTSWQALGAGVNERVRALAVYGGELIAAGNFTSAGGQSAASIAAWNGSSWRPLGQGLNGGALSLAVYNGELIAGGTFTDGFGNPYSLARWNGTSWQIWPLNAGEVWSLVTFNNDLIAGGYFSGGTMVVARWTGNAWIAMDEGLNHRVYALAVHNGALFAGGQFAGGVARWNNASWQVVSGGMSAPVGALLSFNNVLVAAGDFLTAGGGSANHIAAWNNANWLPMGSGMNGPVLALGTHDGQLFAGGDFTTAGGEPASRIAGLLCPINDNCMNAILKPAGTHSYFTTGATTDGPDEPGSCNFNGQTHIQNDVWFRYLATCSGTLTISLCGSNFDTKMAAYIGCPSSPGSAIACNDDFCGTSSRISFQATAGVVYRIRIGSATGATGSGTMTISCGAAPCFGDITGDGQVNVNDLLAVINAWGACPVPPQPCPSDIVPPGGDGIVNVNDLLAVINAWGGCR